MHVQKMVLSGPIRFLTGATGGVGLVAIKHLLTSLLLALMPPAADIVHFEDVSNPAAQVQPLLGSFAIPLR